MLPPEAKTYFEALSSSAASDAWVDLDRKLEYFKRLEFARGQGPDGEGFAARLAALYKENLAVHAQAIAEVLKSVHRSFNSPLDEGVDAQLLDWGARALSDAYQHLERAYADHLRRYGVQRNQIVALVHAYEQARATVANVPTRYLWELRNVPSKRPEQPGAVVPTQLIIHNNGTIGSLQAGAGSIAHVQQQWVQGSTTQLRAAVAELRDKLEHAGDVDPDIRVELLSDIDRVSLELQQERPSKGKLLRWLGGIGAVIGTIGSVQPAYEAVRSLARMLGLPL